VDHQARQRRLRGVGAIAVDQRQRLVAGGQRGDDGVLARHDARPAGAQGAKERQRVRVAEPREERRRVPQPGAARRLGEHQLPRQLRLRRGRGRGSARRPSARRSGSSTIARPMAATAGQRRRGSTSGGVLAPTAAASAANSPLRAE
jgi:hypothetical protein